MVQLKNGRALFKSIFADSRAFTIFLYAQDLAPKDYDPRTVNVPWLKNFTGWIITGNMHIVQDSALDRVDLNVLKTNNFSLYGNK